MHAPRERRPAQHPQPMFASLALHKLVRVAWPFAYCITSALCLMICPHYILSRAEIQAATLALGRALHIVFALLASMLIAAVHAPVMLLSTTHDCFTAVLLMPIVAPLAVLGLSLLAVFHLFQLAGQAIQNTRLRTKLFSQVAAPSTHLVPMPARSQIFCDTVIQAPSLDESTSAPASAAPNRNMSAAASTLATNSSLIQTPVDNVEAAAPAACRYEAALPRVAGDNVQSIELLIDGLRSASTTTTAPTEIL